MNKGISNVIEGRALEISLTGMAIVFSALLLISLFLSVLPKILRVLEPLLPKGHSQPQLQSKPQVSAEIVAAIGAVLHRQRIKS